MLKDLHRFYLTMPEIDYLIGLASSPRDKMVLRILSRTGIRVTELLNIELEDIDFHQGAILIHAEKGGPYKSKHRLVPVNAETLHFIRLVSPGLAYCMRSPGSGWTSLSRL